MSESDDDNASEVVDEAAVGAILGSFFQQQPPPPPRRTQRTQLLIGGGVALVAIAVGVWFFVLRDGRSPCTKLLQPTDELAQLLGVPLRAGYATDNKYFCSDVLLDRDARSTVIAVEREAGGGGSRGVDAIQRRHDRDRYTRIVGMLPNGRLYIADPTAPQPSSEELVAKARERVGQTRDPLGSVLGELPPGNHVLLFVHDGQAVEVKFDTRHVTAAQAEALSAVFMQRASKL